MTLTKKDIIDAIAVSNGHDKKRTAQITDTLIEIIKQTTLESGEDVLISGFGKFCNQHKKPRVGRNPATNKPMRLRKRRRVTFRCSQVLRGRVNG